MSEGVYVQTLEHAPSATTVEETAGGQDELTSPQSTARASSGDDLDSMKAQTRTLLQEKMVLKQEIDGLQIEAASHTDRNKIARIQTGIRFRQKSLSQLSAKIDALFVKMKPLNEAAQAEAKAKAEAERAAAAEAKAAADAQAAAEARARAESEAQAAAEALAAAQAQEAAEARAKKDAGLKTYAQIGALTLGALVDYVATTPAWHERSTLSQQQKDDVTAIHAFAAVPGNRAPCAAFTGAQMIAAAPAAGGSISALVLALAPYVRASGEARAPFEIDLVTDVAKAAAVGAAIRKLTAVFPEWVLATAMTKRVFTFLLDLGYVDDVVSYYQSGTMHPVFQAKGGGDFLAYLQMRANDGVDPRTFQTGTLAPYIRNFHRFEAATLKALTKNLADTTKAKPLTLVLHTAVDHNGAFHRDPYLQTVVTHPKNLTLLIEGGETLSHYQGQIGPLATSHGNNGKIDQVMFAGHGGSRVIEMAGTIEQNTTNTEKYGHIRQDQEAIHLDHDLPAAQAFFDEILANMDQAALDPLGVQGPAAQPNRRILFNACLTNSNEVKTALTHDLDTAAQEIKDYITNNASLATYMRTYALSKGADVESLGANASITQVELIDTSTGALDLVAPTDPKVTASKLVYLEEGTEPHGVMLAALEAWADAPALAIEAMERRAAKNSSKWDEAVIEGVYENVLGYSSQGLFADYLRDCAGTAHGLSDLRKKEKCRVGNLVEVLGEWPEDDAEFLLGRLFASTLMNNTPFVKMVFTQWAAAAGLPDGEKAIMLLLEQEFDAKTARDFIDVAYLVGEGVMGKAMATNPTSKGAQILAVIGLLDDAKPVVCKDHLKALLQPGAPVASGLPAVAPVPEIPQQPAPRALVPEVPAVPGRPKVDEIAGKRAAVAKVDDLPKLDALPKVDAPAPPEPSEDGPVVQVTPVIAPGRNGRPGRDEVAEVKAVKPFFEASLGLEAILAGRSTEDAIIAKLN